jgi:hypothetical protein
VEIAMDKCGNINEKPSQIWSYVLVNVDTLITLYLYFCRWNHLKKRKTIETIKKKFDEITQVMEVARSLKTVPTKNDDQYIWISMQDVEFFEIIVYEKQTFCLMLWT